MNFALVPSFVCTVLMLCLVSFSIFRVLFVVLSNNLYVCVVLVGISLRMGA